MALSRSFRIKNSNFAQSASTCPTLIMSSLPTGSKDNNYVDDDHAGRDYTEPYRLVGSSAEPALANQPASQHAYLNLLARPCSSASNSEVGPCVDLDPHQIDPQLVWPAQ